MRWCRPNVLRAATTIVLLAALAPPAAAQIRGARRQPEPAVAPTVTDPLGRDTPRGTIAGFTSAVHREDWVTAARYMQLTDAQRPSAAALARDLQALLDRYYTEAVTSLSALPTGATDDGLPLDHERIRLTLAQGPVDILLVRVADPQAGRIWLISSGSLATVPYLRPLLQGTWMERLVPEWLQRRSFLGVPLAQWTLWAASIVVPLLLLSLTAGLLVRAARLVVTSAAGRAVLDVWYGGLRRPLIVTLTLGIHAVLTRWLGFSLQFRIVYARLQLGVLVFALAWLVWRLLTLSFAQIRLVALRRGQAGTRSLMMLGERVIKVVVVMATIFALLTIAGVDTTTALAGVGIGGVAVAFGAQKSVENLLGGVFLLTDRALAVGDLCRISGRLGRVEDITLRSVRLRTLEQTLLSIPAGVLSQESVENFVTRDKILIQTTLHLRYGTTAAQLQSVLEGIRALLAEHPQVESKTARIRLVDFGASAFELELFAYVPTADLPTFLAVREELLLEAAAIVEASGTAFARPGECLYVEDAGAEDGHATRSTSAPPRRVPR
jgi:MscS family membrane protein